MPTVTIYSTARCPICDNAKNLLTRWTIPYREITLDRKKTRRTRMMPQILIDEQCSGGFSELTELHMDRQLNAPMEHATQ
jgi:glutaredoxin 3